MLNDAFSDPRTRGPATWTAGALTRRTFARWNVKARQTMSTTPVCQGRQRCLYVAMYECALAIEIRSCWSSAPRRPNRLPSILGSGLKAIFVLENGF